MSKVHGSCLCKKVSCSLTTPFNRFFQCYCDRCQKRSGSAFAALLFTTPDKIEWHTGQELVKYYDLPEAERFRTSVCSQCGSPVPYLSRNKEMVVVPAGFLDGDPEIRPTANIFKEETPCWFDEGQLAKFFDKYPV